MRLLLSFRCREGFLGLSVADTIRQCLRLGLKDAASKLVREFKASERAAVCSAATSFLLQQGAAPGGQGHVACWAVLPNKCSAVSRRSAFKALRRCARHCLQVPDRQFTLLSAQVGVM